jgi:hypothetical protein
LEISRPFVERKTNASAEAMAGMGKIINARIAFLRQINA